MVPISHGHILILYWQFLDIILTLNHLYGKPRIRFFLYRFSLDRHKTSWRSYHLFLLKISTGLSLFSFCRQFQYVCMYHFSYFSYLFILIPAYDMICRFRLMKCHAVNDSYLILHVYFVLFVLGRPAYRPNIE